MISSGEKIGWGKRILRDVGVGAGIIALAALFLVIQMYTGKKITSAWIGLIGYTPVIFWFSIRSLRSQWRHVTFWMAVTGLLVVHLLGFTLILRDYPQWRMFWFIPVAIVEVPIFSAVLDAVFKDSKHKNFREHEK
jgi:hypothetical protein